MHHNRVLIFTESQSFYANLQAMIPTLVAEVKLAKDSVDYTKATIALVDSHWKTDPEKNKLYNELAANGIYTVLVLDEKAVQEDVPDVLSSGLVDDLLLLPIRPIELLGKLKHASYLSKLGEVIQANTNLKSLIEKIEEDIKITRAIQNTLIPKKFKSVYGLKIVHKYLCGLKSGGDYLDFFEFDDKTHVGILMSDSTGYGLSSAFMSVMLRLAVKFSKFETKSPAQTVEKIFEELRVTMKAKENFSIFYGVLNRKTFELVYTGAGTIRFFQFQAETKEVVEPTFTKEVLLKEKPMKLKNYSVDLLPGDRMVLLTDGYSEAYQGDQALYEVIEGNLKGQQMNLVNDLTFAIKQKLEEEDDLPEQDCSVMVIDVEKSVMRLAK